MKKTVILFSLLIVMLLSACSIPVPPAQVPNPGAAQPAAPVVAPQPQQVVNQPRTINVVGSGQVSLAPDVAYVLIGVQSMASNVGDALTDNNKKAETVAQALKELGIDPKDIQTSSFNIYPQPQYGPQGEIISNNYNVNNTVYVTVRDLKKLGQLLDVAVRSGANSINGITNDVVDKSAATTQARQLAIQSAHTQAAEIAQTAGVALGDIQSLTINASNQPIPMYEGKGGYAMDAAQVPVSAGQLVIRVDVNVSYQIK